jgi:undecaprenyl-diphosphatase
VDVIAAALLGVVQGLTEFLPVSSSGHLILARAFFGWDPGRFGIAFDAAVHVGTLLAVVVYFRAEVGRLIAAAPGALSGKDGDYERLGRLIIIGTIPIVIVGGLFGDIIEARIRTPLVVAVNLAIGAVGLMWAERLTKQSREPLALGYGEALAIGLAQAAALAPGLSRSGLTLTMALFLGLRRDTAARFVFLMSLPAVMAVAIKEVIDFSEVGMAGLPVTILGVGLVTSAIVGYVTVKYFVRYLASHSLDVFAYYRFALAAVTVLWLFAR